MSASKTDEQALTIKRDGQRPDIESDQRFGFFELFFSPTAAFRAINNIIPAILPGLSPLERPFADGTDFAGET